ncbi:hypothetical protein ABPG74_012896 [Tetrahymena malaccensis]
MSSGSNLKKVGKYQWSEQDFLGKGAFGSVFKGKNIETGDQVAVKVLQMQHFKNEQAKVQLDEEINVMKKLDSPYIVKLLGLQEENEPWPARDLNSFITNIELLPLRFPYDKPISQESKDFLTQCLQVEEESRIDWNRLFEHPITKKALGPAQDPNIRLDERAKRIIRDIQEIVQIKNLDIKQQFGEYAKNKESLNLDEFHSLICKIDQRLTSVDTDYLFKQIDENNDGTLSLHEFTKFFLEYDFSDITDKASHIITDLKEIIKANKMNLFEIFEKYDENKGGTLDLQEFTKMLKEVANGLKDYEIQVIFRKFDSNNDKNIDFQEFVKIMTYGLQTNLGQFDFSGEKALRVITELKRVIIENNLNEQNIFLKFDVDMDKYLNRREFRDLIRIIDHRLTNQEIHFIFDIFDIDSQNLISLENFEKTLKEKSFKLKKK